MGKAPLSLVLFALTALPQTPDPSYAPLEKAYASLQTKRYDDAIAQFLQALERTPDSSPKKPAIHKDLAYTLLKIGENDAAREHFAAAMRLDPADDHVALEYAFLAYETKQQSEARRVFDRIRKNGNSTAAQAFENVDRPLREGIARWTEALAAEPDNFSAHEELARLAEQRDQLDLAAEHSEKAWRLRPVRRDLLLDLGRIWKQQGRVEEAAAALLAVSRGGEPYTAEQARELLPARYPYVYEFENALKLDPTNTDLRRELAYLHLQMGNQDAADREFQLLPDQPPTLLDRPAAPAKVNAKEMAEKSLDQGYLNDAVRYLQAANEDDPMDFEVMLKLGRTYNVLKDDRDAVRWFDLARQSPDANISGEAVRAFHNLSPDLQRFRTTVWAFPMISTRWRDTFAYAQAKTELRTSGVHPYISVRLIGDVRGAVRFASFSSPQYLSERSAILAAGLATPQWKGASAWFEAGEAIGTQHALPDYRGGITYSRAFRLPHTLFAETNDDAVFISRFDHDGLFYSQDRIGRRLTDSLQVYWNVNATVDGKREYWANTAETGPGARYSFESIRLSVDLLRGVYLKNQDNPNRPNFTDLRIGLWYAFTR